MLALKIAVRSILRNRRRSLVTLASMMIGTAALLCFGQFVAQTVLNFQTGIVRTTGHLAIFKAGYFDFGSGNPVEYGISDYTKLIRRIKSDPELASKITVATPVIRFNAIAGNFENDRSTTVGVIGVVRNDFERMREWDSYRIRTNERLPVAGLGDSNNSESVIGIGVARILGFCKILKVTCPEAPTQSQESGEAAPAYLSDLTEEVSRTSPKTNSSSIDILTATAGGAPNLAKLRVVLAEEQSVRELDNTYLRMHFGQAQQLVFGSKSGDATAIVLQLKSTSDISSAKTRLQDTIAGKNSEFEVRDFEELNPFYEQSVRFLQAIFIFLAVIMTTIVLFAVVNTMTMSVMERISEIGTIRALGARRVYVLKQFLLEGLVLGVTGTTLGVLLSQAVTFIVNRSGITLVLPGTSDTVFLKLFNSIEVFPLIAGVWFILVAVAITAAVLPARRGAKMPIVDALRHV